MSNKNIPRLFVDKELLKGTKISLSKKDIHYLKNVLRTRKRSKINLFNGINGEWQAEVTDVDCKSILCLHQLKKQTILKGPTIYFSLIKSQSLRILIEKATELGVGILCPLITERTNVKKFNEKKAFLYVKEASEVSERLNLPKIQKLISFKDLILETNKKKQKLIFCNETKRDIFLGDFLKKNHSNSFSFLIGPEGGFSDNEKKILLDNKYVVPVRLHDRVVRAETATMLALSILNCYNK